MFVVKRNGTREEVAFDKILNRVKNLSGDLRVEPVVVAQKVVAGLCDGITTKETDRLLIETAASLTPEQADYSRLAGRLAATALHKETPSDWYLAFKKLHEGGILADDFMEAATEMRERLNFVIDYNRDMSFDYFGFETLRSKYLQGLYDKNRTITLKDGSKAFHKDILERPQTLFLRVAIGLCGSNFEEVTKLYDYLSLGLYTHATPTLYNAGTKKPQMSSCFLLAMKDDSIEGIYDTLKECALISKSAGGIGVHIHNVRATNSIIKGTHGLSTGIIPMLRNFNTTCQYVNQGGKRKGSAAIYLEPWHLDVEDFLDLRKTYGNEDRRCHDLFTAMWINDLFMERVEKLEDWTLMCPDTSPGLSLVWGDEFKKLYEQYEAEGRGKKVVKAQDLFKKICLAQKETGVPYIGYKDAGNRKSNQQNLGTIQSSNLCIEVFEYSDKDNSAVCNLGSICVSKFVRYVYMQDGKVDYAKSTIDYEALRRTAYDATVNLDRVIERNYYPTPETRRSNMKNRPIGLGVQGLADVFFKLRLPFESERARIINKNIYETVYFGAMQASIDLAKEFGPYETFAGSPLSEGKFQFDLWNYTGPLYWKDGWDKARKDVMLYGARNSLLTAQMPTATTAHIFKNYESSEIQTSNLFKRETLAGEFMVVNEYLCQHLQEYGLWTERVREQIILADGSIQQIAIIPEEIKAIYKTVWETSQRVVIDMAADRGPFICQSQSMNIYLANPTIDQLASMHIYTWKRGLKTGMYYLRSKAAKENVKVTVSAEEMRAQEIMACSIDNPEACEACT